MLEMRLTGLSYAEIGRQCGVSRQRVQQILAPPKELQQRLKVKYGDECCRCGVRLYGAGHVHHKAVADMTPDSYQDETNLLLVCVSCHTIMHGFDKVLHKRGLRQEIRCPSCGRRRFMGPRAKYCGPSCRVAACRARAKAMA